MTSLRSRITYKIISITYKPLITYLSQRRKRPFWVRRLEKLARLGSTGKKSSLHFERSYIGTIPAAWFIPKQASPERALLYLHGGAYVFGTIDTHKSLIAQIAKASDIKILAIEYRLAPENPFPAALTDALIAYKYLLENGYQPQNIFFAGDSAGGGLTLATLIALRDRQLPLPAKAIFLSPWTDLTLSGNSIKAFADKDPIIVEYWLDQAAEFYTQQASTPRQHPLVSPLFADMHGLPPLLIQVSSEEMLLDDSTRLAERAQQAGVSVTLEVWEGMVHVWHVLYTVLPEAKRAIARIAEFIKN